MKNKITIYEKPTCSKCREVKKLLTEKGVEFEDVNYFEQPLTANALGELLHKAGIGPRDALRSNEPAYKEFVANRELSDDELIKVMVDHPELIQRPIVVRGEKAVLARPAERLKDIGL
jgi:arsenate reductase (glutaredoxin)